MLAVCVSNSLFFLSMPFVCVCDGLILGLRVSIKVDIIRVFFQQNLAACVRWLVCDLLICVCGVDIRNKVTFKPNFIWFAKS